MLRVIVTTNYYAFNNTSDNHIRIQIYLDIMYINSDAHYDFLKLHSTCILD